MGKIRGQSFDRFSGLSKYLQKRAENGKKFARWILEDLGDVYIEDVKKSLKDDTPVHAYITGNLWRNIKQKSVSYKKLVIEADTPYSLTVHEGINRKIPKPFFTFTWSLHRDKYNKFLKDNLHRFFND